MEKLNFPFRSRENKTLSWKKSFLGPLANDQGQTLVTWLILVSFLLLVSIAVGSAFSLLQDRMQVMNICRLESLHTQSNIEPLIKKLFALNPQARLLRTLMIAAKAKLALALATSNPLLAGVARQEIIQIRKQQKLLDQTQKILVQTANLKLYTGTFSTYMKLKAAFHEIKQKSSGWARIEFHLENPKIPKLAVKPEDQNLAPPYLVKDYFEKKQVMSQVWSQKYQVKSFLKFLHYSQSQCHATLEENTWVPKIRRDRLFLK